MLDSFDISWIDPIRLTLAKDDSQQVLVKRLRKEITAATSEIELRRSVYIIRMAGSFIVQYPNGASPVVYIGRGDSVSRLASHVKNWASDMFTWGNNTEIEIRIIRPARKNRSDYFKNVEADLLRWFFVRYGVLPLINSRFEVRWEGGVEYGPSQEKDLWQVLGIGRGNRHKWAITPLPSNKMHGKYYRGS